MFHILVWACNYHSLDSFSEWVSAGRFELRKGGQVKVVIEKVTNEKTLELSPAVRCRECRSRLLESNIIDSAMALNWTAIDDINMKHVVSVTTFKPSHMLFNYTGF